MKIEQDDDTISHFGLARVSNRPHGFDSILTYDSTKEIINTYGIRYRIGNVKYGCGNFKRNGTMKFLTSSGLSPGNRTERVSLNTASSTTKDYGAWLEMNNRLLLLYQHPSLNPKNEGQKIVQIDNRIDCSKYFNCYVGSAFYSGLHQRFYPYLSLEYTGDSFDLTLTSNLMCSNTTKPEPDITVISGYKNKNLGLYLSGRYFGSGYIQIDDDIIKDPLRLKGEIIFNANSIYSLGVKEYIKFIELNEFKSRSYHLNHNGVLYAIMEHKNGSSSCQLKSSLSHSFQTKNEVETILLSGSIRYYLTQSSVSYKISKILYSYNNENQIDLKHILKTSLRKKLGNAIGESSLSISIPDNDSFLSIKLSQSILYKLSNQIIVINAAVSYDDNQDNYSLRLSMEF